MTELISLVTKHLRMVLRYRWLALASAVLFCLVGWTAVQLIPPRYEVTAKLFFDPRSLLQPLLEGLALQNVFELQTASVRRLLFQRKSLERIAREGGFDVEVDSPVEFERTLTELASNIQISQTADGRGNKTESVFTVSYQDRDPKRAVRVVRSLVDIFMEESRGETRTNASQSRQFLDEQIEEYQEKLNEAEAKLWRFKEKNFDLLSKQEDYFSRLKDFREKIEEGRLQLKEVESRRDQIESQIQRARATGIIKESDLPIQPNVPQDPIDVRINRLQERLDELLTKYTVRHPEVVYAQRTLDQLLKQKVTGLRQSVKAVIQGEREPVENPVYRNLKLALGAAEAQFAAIRARLQEYQRREEQLRATVNSSLEVEAEFQRLNRSYNIDKGQFEEFVRRRELLNVTDEAVQDDDLDLQVKLLEPPLEPVVPIGPSNKLLNFGVFLGSVGGGLGLAWFIAMMKPVIYTKEELEEVADLPVWGTVSTSLPLAARWLRGFQHAAFAAGWAGLVIISYGVVVQEGLSYQLLLQLTNTAA